MGARKEEISRLDWSQIRLALQTGVLEITRKQNLKTGARSVTLAPNLKAWLSWYLQRNPTSEGPVLRQGRRLDDLQKRIERQSKVKWIANSGRHSFITYRTKVSGQHTEGFFRC